MKNVKRDFSKVFYGYDKKQVDRIVAEKLQEWNEEKAGNKADDSERQLENMINLLKLQLATTKLRRSVLRSTFIYAQDFKDYLKYKAQGAAQDILKEAKEYVKQKESEIAGVTRKIEEAERNLAMVYSETSSILSAVPAFVSVKTGGMKSIAFSGNEEPFSANETKAEIGGQPQLTATPKAPLIIKGYTVLVAEEDEVVARLLAVMLEREGFGVTVVKDGQEAMHFINTMTPPHIVMLDFMLPYFGGLQLLKALRAKSAWDNVIVMMIAESSNERDIIFAMKNGADDYIQKPFNPREVAVKLVRFVERTSTN